MEHTESIFVVAQQCFDLGLRAGAIVFEGLRVGDSPPELRARVKADAARLRERFGDLAALRAAPEIAAFADVYRAAGVKRNSERPGCTRLVEYAWKRLDLPAINNVVDAYNTISIEWLLSLGAHDAEVVTLPIRLERIRNEIAFVPLGGYRGGPVSTGEFAYVDGAGRVICRLDVIQAEFSKVTPRTSRIVLIVEGTDRHTPSSWTSARTALINAIDKYCRGSVSAEVWPF